MLTFLIMAGGSGERFWPLSTKENPKQLLHIFDEKSLLRLTYERILPLTDNKHIFVATNKIQAKKVKEELKELDASRIIIEPSFKDTASAICYGSLIISKYIDNPTIAVLASDHLIKDEDKFRMIFDEIFNGNDQYFILKDLPSYIEAQEKASALYQDKKKWAQMCLMNIANSGYFSSDRTIEEYVRDIWKLEKIS